MSKDPEDALELARDILRYFVRNPEAADTIEGVARWRLLDEKIHSTMQEVRRAIAWLAAQGLVVEDQLPSSRTLFRLNRDAMLQIEHLLRPGKPGGTKKKNRRK